SAGRLPDVPRQAGRLHQGGAEALRPGRGTSWRDFPISIKPGLRWLVPGLRPPSAAFAERTPPLPPFRGQTGLAVVDGSRATTGRVGAVVMHFIIRPAPTGHLTAVRSTWKDWEA